MLLSSYSLGIGKGRKLLKTSSLGTGMTTGNLDKDRYMQCQLLNLKSWRLLVERCLRNPCAASAMLLIPPMPKIAAAADLKGFVQRERNVQARIEVTYPFFRYPALKLVFSHHNCYKDSYSSVLRHSNIQNYSTLR